MLTVLSLFDGMSCGAIALHELGVPVKYYASEIDQHAIKQTKLNFPDTVHLGDVSNWRTWDLDWSSINLVLAGSPCQGFSFAGKQLAFDDPRSKLFFVFVEILNHIKKLNPDVKFLLENVNMKKDHLRVISEYVGVFPVNINSNLVSAQNRDRWYWTNIRTKKVGLFDELYVYIPQPEDKGILLKDILQSDVDEKYFISQAVINRIERKTYSEPQLNPDKTGALNTKNNSGQMSIDSGTTFISVLNDNGILRETEKANCLDANYHKGMDNHAQRSFIVAMRGREDAVLTPKRTEYGKQIRKQYEAGEITEQRKNIQKLEPRLDGKTNTITSVQKDNLVMTSNYLQITGNGFDSDNRFWKEEGKHAACVTRGADKTGVLTQSRIRRLTPTECARLQTVPDWYKWECSDTQIYRMCGNGWTVEVIKHILSFGNFLNQ